MKTNLRKVIDSNPEEISFYLENVEVSDFVQDVKDVISEFADRGAISSAIERLKELL